MSTSNRNFSTIRVHFFIPAMCCRRDNASQKLFPVEIPAYVCLVTCVVKTTCIFFCFRYERLLRRAKTEDLSEISGIGCLYQSGHDRYGRPVIVFVGKWFRFKEINLDKVSAFNVEITLL